MLESELVSVKDILEDLLILLRGLEWKTGWGVVDVVPADEKLGRIGVALLFEDTDLVFGAEH